MRGERDQAGKIAHVTHSKFDLPVRADLQQTVSEVLLYAQGVPTMTKRLFRPGRAAVCATLFLYLFPFPASASGGRETPSATQASNAGLVLEGVVSGSQNQTYVQVPFNVPAGTERVTLTFAYTGKEQHTALDLGLLDPAGLPVGGVEL